MTTTAQAKPDPRRYFETVGDERGAAAKQEPVCLYLETTNRCNLLCETCPRTFEDLEPPADMSWELFTHIVDQFPRIPRVVLHGVGDGTSTTWPVASNASARAGMKYAKPPEATDNAMAVTARVRIRKGLSRPREARARWPGRLPSTG